MARRVGSIMKMAQPMIAQPSSKQASGSAQWNSAPKSQIQSGRKAPIRVLLVDDHPVVRRGLTSCLALNEQVVVVGEAGDGQEGVRKAKELMPDVVLMDIDMPQMNGLNATEILRR